MTSQPLPRDVDADRLVRRVRDPIAVTQREAARLLSVSVDTFVRYIAPELRVVYVGRCRLYPVRELERWLELNASRPLDA